MRRPAGARSDISTVVYPLRGVSSAPGHLVTVGRETKHDLVIPDASVSRFHAFLKADDAGVFSVQDMASTNGTTVNGASVPARGAGPPTAMKPGDNVCFGQVQLTFTDARALREFVLQAEPAELASGPQPGGSRARSQRGASCRARRRACRRPDLPRGAAAAHRRHHHREEGQEPRHGRGLRRPGDRPAARSRRAFPDDLVVGEENADELRTDAQAAGAGRRGGARGRRGFGRCGRKKRCSAGSIEAVPPAIQSATGRSIRSTAPRVSCAAINTPVALGLIENGEVVLGVLGCPNLPTGDSTPGAMFLRCGGRRSAFLRAVGRRRRDGQRGAGRPGREDLRRALLRIRRVGVIRTSPSPPRLRACWASTASPSASTASAKYAAVARGDASIYLRMPTRADYREKIWDHAAGKVVVEAGGWHRHRCARSAARLHPRTHARSQPRHRRHQWRDPRRGGRGRASGTRRVTLPLRRVRRRPLAPAARGRNSVLGCGARRRRGGARRGGRWCRDSRPRARVRIRSCSSA